jgi:hypothetical protein
VPSAPLRGLTLSPADAARTLPSRADSIGENWLADTGSIAAGYKIGDHLRNVGAALPPGVKQIYGRADSGFYCREAIEGYGQLDARFVVCARKTARLVERLAGVYCQLHRPQPGTRITH